MSNKNLSDKIFKYNTNTQLILLDTWILNGETSKIKKKDFFFATKATYLQDIVDIYTYVCQSEIPRR
jgi:hypothetical protein